MSTGVEQKEKCGYVIRLLGFNEDKFIFNPPWSGLHIRPTVETKLWNIISQYLSREKLIGDRLPLNTKLIFEGEDYVHLLEGAYFVSLRTNLPMRVIHPRNLEDVTSSGFSDDIATLIVDFIVEHPQCYVFPMISDTSLGKRIWEELSQRQVTESIIIAISPLGTWMSEFPLNVFKPHSVWFGHILGEDKEEMDFHRSIVRDILSKETKIVHEEREDGAIETTVYYWDDDLLEAICKRAECMSTTTLEEKCFELSRRWALKNKPTPSIKLINEIFGTLQTTQDNGEEENHRDGGCHLSK